MIARTLVPHNLAPVTPEPGDARARRGSTSLDSRSLIPNDLPIKPIDTRSVIPSHVPLEVLGEKILIPRDSPTTPLPDLLLSHAPRTALDSRITVPRDAQPRALEIHQMESAALPEVLDRDVFTTGEVHLLTKPIEEEFTGWHAGRSWQSNISSIVFHVMIIGLLVAQPKLFPFKGPSAEQVELARKTMNLIYTKPIDPGPPPGIAAPPVTPRTSPSVRIDPDVLRRVAPVEPQPRPGPKEEATVRSESELTAPPLDPPRAAAAPPVRDLSPAPVEPPKQPATNPNLSPFALPRASAGRALEESLRGAAREGGTARSLGFGGSVPSGIPGGGGAGQVYGNMEMLTPTEGVDFTNYLARVLASVRRNWYAVIPESAKLGEKGIVVLQFRIMKNGAVPHSEPALMRTSGREPLDLAAMSSIRASNPFEPLPNAFSGPFIELRFTFLYNLPIEAAR